MAKIHSVTRRNLTPRAWRLIKIYLSIFVLFPRKIEKKQQYLKDRLSFLQIYLFLHNKDDVIK